MRKLKLQRTFPLLMAVLLAMSSISLIGMKTSKAESSYTVNPYIRYQEVEGWGTSLVWWANMAGGWDWKGPSGKEVREELMELIFGKDGLEYTIARYNVGGGDDPDCEYNPEEGESHMRRGGYMEGFKMSEDGSYDWNADANQRWVLDWINKNVDDAYIEFFSNSAPWWMTKSGCASGAVNANDDNMSEGYEDDFAQYLVDVLEHLIKVDGINIKSMQPFNETSSSWWEAGSAKQEGMKLTDQQRSDVLAYTYKMLNERSLDVEVAGLDCTGPQKALSSYLGLRDTEITKADDSIYTGDDIRAGLDKLSYHLYENGGSSNSDRERRAALRRSASNDGKGLWMSEIGYSENDNLSGGMTTGLRHSTQIRETLNGDGANAYVIWQIVEELSSQVGADSNYGPIKASYFTKEEAPVLASLGYDVGSITVDKQYYVLGQYSKYIKPGYFISDSNDSNTVVAVSPDGSQVVLVIENKDDANYVSYTLDGYTIQNASVIRTDDNSSWKKDSVDSIKGNKISLNLTKNSVTTIVLDTTPYKADKEFVDDANGEELAVAAEATAAQLPMAERFYYTSYASANVATYLSFTNSRHGVSLLNDGDSAVMKFTGTGIGLSGIRQSSSAVKVYIDGEQYEANGAKGENSCTLAPAGISNGGRISFFKVEDLTDGEHLLRVTYDSGTVRLDGAYIKRAADKVAVEDINVLYTRAQNGKLAVSFEADAAGEYSIEYRVWDDIKFISVPVTIDDNKGGDLFTKVIDGLGEGIYKVRVKYDDKYSFTETVTMMYTSVNSPLYYVDLGAVSLKYGVSDRVALNGSAKDSVYQLDAITGKSWGRTSEGNEVYAMGKAGSPFEASLTTMSGDGNSNGIISYKFEVGKAVKTYDLVISGVDHWGTRYAEISVNGVKQSTNFEMKRAGDYDTYPNISYYFLTGMSADADGFIEISIKKAPGYDNPLIGTILIAESDSPVAAVVSAYGTKSDTPVTGNKRIENLEFIFGNKMDISYYAYMTDGTVEEINKANIDNLNVQVVNTEIAINGGEITGIYQGFMFGTGFSVSRAGNETYYFIDCGGQSSEKPPVIGTLQSGTWDKQSTNTSTWGYMDPCGVNWASDPYTTGVRNANQKYLRYRLTGLTVGKTIKVTLGSHSVWGWNPRAFDVYFRDDIGGAGSSLASTFNTTQADGYVGTITFTSDGQARNVSAVMTITNETMYVMAFNKEEIQHPQISYIIVEDVFTAIPAQSLTVNKSEAAKDSTVRLGNLVTGAHVLVTDQNNRIIEQFIATGATYDLNLANYNLYNAQALKIVQRTPTSSNSAVTQVALPGVSVINVMEDDWKDRKILHFTPTLGIQFETLLITDNTTGETTDVTDNEYFYYIAYGVGSYTATITTKSGNTFVHMFEINNIDTLLIDYDTDIKDWTTSNVKLSFEALATSGISELWINGEQVELEADYSYTVTENMTYVIKIVSLKGIEKTFVIEVKNIDKAAPLLSITPDFSLSGGFKADIIAEAISGGTLTVKKGTEAVSVDGNTVYLIEKGEYSIKFVNNVGAEINKTLNIAYGANNAVLSNVSINKGELTAAAKTGTVEYTLYKAGGAAVSKVNGKYDVSEGGRYILYAESGDKLETVILEINKYSSKTGCGSTAMATPGSIGGMTTLLLGAMAILLIKNKALKTTGGRNYEKQA